MVLCLLGVMAAAGGLVQRAAAATPSTPAAATTDATVVRAHIDVIQLNGLIDPIEAAFVRQAIGEAERGGALALVVQLSSTGGVLRPSAVDALATRISSSSVPVAIWVGPNGSKAYGAAYAIFRAAPLRGVSPGIHLGDAPPLVSGAPDPLAGRTIGSGQALDAKVANINAPTLGDFVVSLDGQVVDGTTLHTAEVYKASNGELRRRPTITTDFRKISIVEQLLHTAASPSVAYLLLLIGMLLAALEFFTAGIGIAAFCGAGCLVLSSYGLGVLPIRPWFLVLIVVGVFGYCIDVQAGVPRVWTAVGTVAVAIGTFRLYEHVHLSPLAAVAGIAGTTLFMIAGMPAMVRARFSTPTIGRDSMIGEMGIALAAIEPEGTVEVHGAPWRARTNRATPIAAGAAVRVVAIDGLLLEVEPETGGAKDAHH